jgi:hypothetical protein
MHMNLSYQQSSYLSNNYKSLNILFNDSHLIIFVINPFRQQNQSDECSIKCEQLFKDNHMKTPNIIIVNAEK